MVTWIMVGRDGGVEERRNHRGTRTTTLTDTEPRIDRGIDHPSRFIIGRINPRPTNPSLSPGHTEPRPINPSAVKLRVTEPSALNTCALNASAFNASALNASALNTRAIEPSTSNPGIAEPSVTEAARVGVTSEVSVVGTGAFGGAAG